MKVNIFNRELNNSVKGTVGAMFGTVSTVISFLNISVRVKICLFVFLAIAGVVIYVAKLIYANRINKLTLKYQESTIEIKSGDIFSDEYKNDGIWRVFAFNEYFDTVVDDVIISSKTLNGQFIIREVQSVSALDASIKKDIHLNKRISYTNRKRELKNKNVAYKLGSIFRYSSNVFLTAMTFFNSENHAHLSIQEYQKFLINFWDEINDLYSGKTVVIPLLGSGAVTRLDGNIYTSNQILEIILWTFYLRRIKFRKPAHLVILLDEETNKRINYYQIRSMFNGLQK